MQVLKYGNDDLKQKCEDIEIFDSELKSKVDQMYETMKNENGIGLAAPQIGWLENVIVVDTQEEDGIGRLNLINPRIIEFSEKEVEYNEGCLSIPEVYAPVMRPEKIKVEAYRPNGKKFSFKADKMLARVIQHEIDHLNGVLFVERITDPQALEEIEPKLEEILAAETKVFATN